MFSDALLTDFYELTMAAGYFEQGLRDDTAAFEFYFRQCPFGGGYAVAAGLETAVRAITATRFNTEDLAHLASLRSSAGLPIFSAEFLRYLEGYRFQGNIRAVPEGTVVFANEPLVEVRGGLIECQMVETMLLCHMNFQTLVATKAARVWEASQRGLFVEFGMRRAQGPNGAVSACRAAYIGGAAGTSNVLGSAVFGVPPRGTQAHSWIQSFPAEVEAFRAYARSFPDDCILLVDTYDVLESGVPNAIRVAKELEVQGHRLSGIRIDSGDLAFLSREARCMLDREGCSYVKIVASNELDEYLVAEILGQGGRIDIWGIGTRLVTGDGPGGGALGGIYKLVEHNGLPKIKRSNNPAKMTTPGRKRVVRFFGSDGQMEADAVAGWAEDVGKGEVQIIDPINPLRRKSLARAERIDLLQPIVTEGRPVCCYPSLEAIRERRREQLDRLHESHRRLHNPHEYKVGLTSAMWQLKERMLRQKVLE